MSPLRPPPPVVGMVVALAGAAVGCGGSGTAGQADPDAHRGDPPADGAAGAVQVCAPWSSIGVCLDAHSYERCTADGMGWERAVCAGDTQCRVGRCTDQICVPGARACVGLTEVRVCSAAGDSWRPLQACAVGGACLDGACLSPCEVNAKDGLYLGCEYWAVDLDNVEEAAAQPVGIVVSVPEGGAHTEVLITDMTTGRQLPASALGVSDLFVGPGGVGVFRLPLAHDIDGSGVSARSFAIRTAVPVSVHQFNPLQGQAVYSNDASLLLPAQVVTGDYLVMSWPHRQDHTATLRGFAAVIATQPGETEVQVTPTASVVAGPGVPRLAAGVVATFTLAQGQVLNLETEGGDAGDLTGTAIRANRPVNVVAGHECANVPTGVHACDHIESQLFPVQTWGERYICDAFAPRSEAQVDLWRVMGGANGVTVTTDPPVPGYERFALQRGTWVEFATAESFVVDADGPVLVGHFLSGSSYPGADKTCGDTALGDPAFTLVVPEQRYLRRYAVLIPEGYATDTLNVVAPLGASVAVDGTEVAGPPRPIGASTWGLTRVPVSPGVHAVTGSARFGLTAYGYDCDVSYAYPGGLQLETVREVVP